MQKQLRWPVSLDRFSTVKDATAVCPNIRMVHVATYAEGESEARYHEHADRQTHKVSLDTYRREVRARHRLAVSNRAAPHRS